MMRLYIRFLALDYSLIIKPYYMLYPLFQSVQSEAEFNELIELMFTEHERELMLERWRIFDALDRGLTQREVSKEVPCSIVTATRGAKVYRDNKNCVQRFLEIYRRKT